VTLEGGTPRTLSVLARALTRAGRTAEARETAKQALALQPDHPQALAVLAGLPSTGEPGGWTARMRAAWRAWRGR
jgi:Flp pilus assembly protein TadD